MAASLLSPQALVLTDSLSKKQSLVARARSQGGNQGPGTQAPPPLGSKLQSLPHFTLLLSQLAGFSTFCTLWSQISSDSCPSVRTSFSLLLLPLLVSRSCLLLPNLFSEHANRTEHTWVQIWLLLLPNCVTLGKSALFSKFLFPHLSTKEDT